MKYVWYIFDEFTGKEIELADEDGLNLFESEEEALEVASEMDCGAWLGVACFPAESLEQPEFPFGEFQDGSQWNRGGESWQS